MRFERLCGRRIVPHLLALFHLPVTCHQSGHIPPPAESRGGWPLCSTSISHSPPAESFGNQVGRLTYFLSSWGLEAHTSLRNGCRCHRHCDVLVCGLVPWHLRDPDQSTCVCRLKSGLNSGVFLSILLHMPYPNRGVIWHSVQSVFTRLFT